MDKQTLSKKFETVFADSKQEEKIRFFSAPGRINIIGEHVDYAGGIVLPAAIDVSIKIAIRKNSVRRFRIFSMESNELVESESAAYSNEFPWVNYAFGVIEEFKKLGYSVDFFDAVIWGNIPQGAGLSSSAAFEVGMAFALSEIHGWNLKREDIALLGQRAENHFVGVQCGIMDQFAIATGKVGHCISLNTETLEYHYHPIELSDCEFYLIDSKVKHSLKDSAYNDRRKEVESAFFKIRNVRNSLSSLYQAELGDLGVPALSEVEAKRARHVVTERMRTEEAVRYLRGGDPASVGKILFECHRSLSKDYEVSCEETDFIVEQLRKEAALGARMIGGGFGGCILVLDQRGRKDQLFEKIKSRYFEKFGREPILYTFRISDGVGEF
ncbi:galactokinase [Leptospira gomenensis]|uniref:Galactokinase n=1 Tax=Leptospira gomenensis TaxID=2484974 RepID=A0A5F1YF49_9LEPT|nr:galactokinase [Leptospira gomenensis]TGK34390.1 galactokinase [Leptospira gomenensis]TGK37250.1 galactokinase [Leptospira gomenensis]TGK50937.1 galactokinase [Leptospira gomenensis]TGK56634.1 galactokinase [Leptospira gomenensis]